MFFFFSGVLVILVTNFTHIFLLSLLLPVTTVSSLEHSSPITEGRSRLLRSSRSFGGSSVSVVKMTPLSFLPGTRIVKYLGIINMFFIRETTSLREVRCGQKLEFCVAVMSHCVFACRL